MTNTTRALRLPAFAALLASTVLMTGCGSDSVTKTTTTSEETRSTAPAMGATTSTTTTTTQETRP